MHQRGAGAVGQQVIQRAGIVPENVSISDTVAVALDNDSTSGYQGSGGLLNCFVAAFDSQICWY